MLHMIENVETFFHKRDQLGIKPGLDRVHFLLEKLNHPEQKIKTVHVAGTNGKGSTIQFMQKALMANNYEVGVFTSPSFIGIRGHFFINDVPATEESVIQIINQMMPYIHILDEKDEAPTSFEIITVMAFVYFTEKVDIALIETGMGGRLDTTNCFIPEVSVITNISMDHMHFLGDTLSEIAWHKAGIIKDGVPVVIGRMKDQASLDVFMKESEEKSAPIYQLGETFSYHRLENGVLKWWDNHLHPFSFSIQMNGAHQADNAAVAVKALMLLKEKGVILKEEKIQQGLEAAVLPGRFEIINSNPTMILDSAHNLAGVHAFVSTLKQAYPNNQKVVLFAGFKDKQLPEMVQEIEQNVDELLLTTFEHPRAASLKSLEDIPLQINRQIVPSWKDTVQSVMKRTTTEKMVFCMTGSLHFITEVRHFINSEKR